MNIGWKLSALDAGVASIRHRALFPSVALREHQIGARIFGPGSAHNLSDIDALVIVKGFSAEDLSLAQAAAARQIPVIYDLCDNIFAPGYGDHSATRPIEIVRQIARVAAAFVTPTDALADQVRVHLGTDLPVHVVPDGIETEALHAEATRIIQAARPRLPLRPLIQRLRRAHPVRRMLDLARTASARGIGRRLLSLAYRRLEPIRARILRRPSRVAPRELRAAEPSAAARPVRPQFRPNDGQPTQSVRSAPAAAAATTVKL